jgi:hypothetical protein
MSQRIRFNDDILYLTFKIKALRDGLSLEADPAMFARQAASELFFVAGCLDSLGRFLEANQRLIDWPEYLRSLYLLERQFVDLLALAIDDESGYGRHFGDDLPRLADLLEDRRGILEELRRSLGQKSREEAPADDVVSKDELDELLRGGEST